MLGIKRPDKDFRIVNIPENNVLSDKLLVLGAWLCSGSSVITELASKFSFNWLLFDLEHGYLSEQSLFVNLQVVHRKNINVIVRVPDINPALIGRVLDWGATGIMVLTASAARGKIAVILISDVKHAGFTCLAISSDIGIIRSGYEHLISKYKTISEI